MSRGKEITDGTIPQPRRLDSFDDNVYESLFGEAVGNVGSPSVAQDALDMRFQAVEATVGKSSGVEHSVSTVCHVVPHGKLRQKHPRQKKHLVATVVEGIR